MKKAKNINNSYLNLDRQFKIRGIGRTRPSLHDLVVFTRMDKKLIDTISLEEKTNIYQQLEIQQGIRLELNKSNDLSPACQRIIKNYRKLPSGYRKKYANIIKKHLYESIIDSYKC